MKKSKVFNNNYSANEYAKKVNGKVRQSYLPNYMWVDLIWVVEWEEEICTESITEEC